MRCGSVQKLLLIVAVSKLGVNFPLSPKGSNVQFSEGNWKPKQQKYFFAKNQSDQCKKPNRLDKKKICWLLALCSNIQSKVCVNKDKIQVCSDPRLCSFPL